MKKFTRLMCIYAMLLIAGSNEVWALRYAKAVIYAEPANGGYVGFDSNPTKNKAEASLFDIFYANPSYMGYTNAGGRKATVREKGKSSAIDVAEKDSNVVIKYLNE